MQKSLAERQYQAGRAPHVHTQPVYPKELVSDKTQKIAQKPQGKGVLFNRV